VKRLALLGCLWLLGSAPAGASPLDGDWFILTGRNAVSSSAPGLPVVKELAERGRKADLKGAAFTAAGDWTILFGGNGVASAGDVPDALSKKIPELWKSGAEIKCVAFRPQGGWVLLYNQNDFVEEGLPAGTQARLQEVKKAGGTLRAVAFAPDGGWVVLGDKGAWGEGLPTSLSDRLAEHGKKKIPIRCVAFTSQGDWFLIDDRNDCQSSNTSHPAFKKLEELQGQKETLRWIAFSPGEWISYALEHKPTQRVKAVLTYDVEKPDGGVAEWVMYAPQAPELDRQRDIKTAFGPAGKRVQELSPLKRNLLLQRVTDRPKAVQTKLVYEMTLYTTRLVPGLSGAPSARVELDPEQVKHYTRASAHEDFEAKAFQEWLDRAGLRRGDREGDMTFARRAYSYLKHHFTYEYRPEGMDRHASAVCRKGKSDCGGLSMLFVAVMRANGVPARSLWGRWALSEVPPKKKGEATDVQTHVKAEFFARGVGWAPVDMAAALADEREFGCFGNDQGDFVVMHLDADLRLDVFERDRIDAMGMQGPWWWCKGGAGKDERVEEHWTVEAVKR
jgi:transglutaminase-like putative cysteine protease